MSSRSTMRVIAARIALLSFLLAAAGIGTNATPLVWLSLALGLIGLAAFAAALRGDV